MAKISSVQKNNKRKKLVEIWRVKRLLLKSKIYDKELPLAERFALVLKLSSLPRASSVTRVRERCGLTGRPRGVYKKFGLSRNMLRDLAGKGFLPGVIKSSW